MAIEFTPEHLELFNRLDKADGKADGRITRESLLKLKAKGKSELDPDGNGQISEKHFQDFVKRHGLSAKEVEVLQQVMSVGATLDIWPNALGTDDLERLLLSGHAKEAQEALYFQVPQDQATLIQYLSPQGRLTLARQESAEPLLSDKARTVLYKSITPDQVLELARSGKPADLATIVHALNASPNIREGVLEAIFSYPHQLRFVPGLNPNADGRITLYTQMAFLEAIAETGTDPETKLLAMHHGLKLKQQAAHQNAFFAKAGFDDAKNSPPPHPAQDKILRHYFGYHLPGQTHRLDDAGVQTQSRILVSVGKLLASDPSGVVEAVHRHATDDRFNDKFLVRVFESILRPSNLSSIAPGHRPWADPKALAQLYVALETAKQDLRPPQGFEKLPPDQQKKALEKSRDAAKALGEIYSGIKLAVRHAPKKSEIGMQWILSKAFGKLPVVKKIPGLDWVAGKIGAFMDEKGSTNREEPVTIKQIHQYKADGERLTREADQAYKDLGASGDNPLVNAFVGASHLYEQEELAPKD